MSSVLGQGGHPETVLETLLLLWSKYALQLIDTWVACNLDLVSLMM